MSGRGVFTPELSCFIGGSAGGGMVDLELAGDIYNTSASAPALGSSSYCKTSVF